MAGAGTGRIADALVQAESNLATVREHGIGLYFEPLLLATMARCRLAGGESDGALAAAEEAFALQIERARTPPARPRAAEQVR